MSHPDALRLLNLGPTNWLRTQSVYRSTALLVAEGSPDAIIVSTPLHGYVAVGGGCAPQDVLDLAACVRLDVPVVRSPLSQPVTYLDEETLIFQGVFYQQDVEAMRGKMLSGVREGLTALGIHQCEIAEHRITVGARTLVEAQSGTIGEAVTIQCALFLSLNGRILHQLTSEKAYTCLWSELARPASPEMIQTALLEALSGGFNRLLERDRPRKIETSLSKRIDLELLEEAAALLRTEVIHDAHD